MGRFAMSFVSIQNRDLGSKYPFFLNYRNHPILVLAEAGSNLLGCVASALGDFQIESTQECAEN